MRHLKEQNAECPDVDLLRLLLPVVNFRSHVLVGPAEGVLDLLFPRAHPEVDQLGGERLPGENDVLGLDVPVNYASPVQVTHALHHSKKHLQNPHQGHLGEFPFELEQSGAVGVLQFENNEVGGDFVVEQLNYFRILNLTLNFELLDLFFPVDYANNFYDVFLLAAFMLHQVNLSVLVLLYFFELVIRVYIEVHYNFKYKYYN